MTKKNQTKRALLLSALSLLMCVSMFVGSTFAWFTDSVTSGRNKIVAGNLDVVLEYKTDWSKEWAPVDENTKLFKEGALYEPGYTEVVYLRVSNAGSLALKYNLMVNIAREKSSTNVNGETFKLSDYLEFGTYIQSEYNGESNYADILMPLMFGTREGALNAIATSGNGFSKLSETDSIVQSGAPVPAGDKTAQIVVLALTMPETVGNEANHDSAYAAPEIELGVSLVAAQLVDEKDSFGNDYDKDAEYPASADTWDGTYDTAWYFENPDAPVFTLNSAEQLAGLAKLVDGGAIVPASVEYDGLPVTFDGKTIYLDADVDLHLEDENGEVICFDPIGSYRNETAFKGIFDAQGHTIKNMNQNTWALDNGYYYSDCGLGLFGSVEDAQIKNLTMDGADLSGETALVGIVAATAYGDCTFENIKVTNSRGADYQYYAGGIVGWASGNHQYINCEIDASTTIAAQWGDFDNSTGGVIGGAGGSAKILMKDCNVACRIDAYNDVTSSYQWYAYRRCGMLIGNPGKTIEIDGTTYAAAPQLTCENVTVTYGDWANYTYCEFAGTSWPYVRVQAGVSNSAYSNPRYGHPTDSNGNQVVDDNHVHNDGEDHQILCEFDQLYGGGQGVYGTAAHDGVTVIYNNH